MGSCTDNPLESSHPGLYSLCASFLDCREGTTTDSSECTGSVQWPCLVMTVDSKGGLGGGTRVPLGDDAVVGGERHEHSGLNQGLRLACTYGLEASTQIVHGHPVPCLSRLF